MRVLFDQGTPLPLRQALPQHSVETAFERGWSTLANGDLLAAAEADGFDVMETRFSTRSQPADADARAVCAA